MQEGGGEGEMRGGLICEPGKSRKFFQHDDN